MDTPRVTIKNLFGDLNQRVDALKKDSSTVKASRAIVEKALVDGDTHYGINTGFGALANKRISKDELRDLQYNFLLSHSV